MRPALASPLWLGSLQATAAGEDALGAVETCVRGALDYFRRADGARPPERIALDRLSEALCDGARRLFLLSPAQGGPCGLLELALDTPAPGEVTLSLLVLARGARRRGLGGELVRDLVDLLRRRGYHTLRLGVASGEESAARFWESVGLLESGQSQGVRLFELALGAPA
jgi:ribosomal protein S18 acetylase RimI-like enzyme